MFDSVSAMKASDSEVSSENNSPTNYQVNPGVSSNRDNERPKSQQHVPLSKRIACVICRRRKLRCDGARPACGTCARLHHDCVYEETRRKSGPKRGYVKMLEERLAHVEGLLNSNVGTTSVSPPPVSRPVSAAAGSQTMSDVTSVHVPQSISASPTENPLIGAPQTPLSAQQSVLPNEFGAINLGDDLFSTTHPHIPGENIFDMIALGMDEPLPPQSMIDELHTLYFERQHIYVPMIHKPRYMASLNYPPNLQPPLYLRYAVWTLAASMSPKYRPYAAVFYNRTRKYLEQTQMRGHGENVVALPFTQAWVLVSMYEYKVMYFPRAWLSAGMACRSALMLQTNRLDSPNPTTSKHCLVEPTDSTEHEERRRTFWGAFCADRYSSIGTGWPPIIDEVDIATNLPASEAAFEASVEETTCSLDTALNPSGTKFIRKLSVFASHVLVIAVFGRIHSHLHRGDSTAGEQASQENFFERFRYIDNLIHTIMLSLPSHVKRPMGPMSPTGAELIMSVHATTICLHQATIFRTRRARNYQSEFETSKQRCLQAASEITTIMQSCSHFDMASFDAFMSFCIYIAARCFVQALRTSPNGLDPATRTRLDFLLTALDHMKEDMPIAQSFLLQLEVDMASLLGEESGLLGEGSGVLVDCSGTRPSPSSNPSIVSDSEVPSEFSQMTPPDDVLPYFDSASIVHAKIMKLQNKKESSGRYSQERNSPDATVRQGPGDVGVKDMPQVPLESWRPTSTSTSTSGNDAEMIDGDMVNSISTLSPEVCIAARQRVQRASRVEAVGIDSLTSTFAAPPLNPAPADPDVVMTMQLNELEGEQHQLLQLQDQRQELEKTQLVQDDEQVRQGQREQNQKRLDILGLDFGVCGIPSGEGAASSGSPKPWTPADMEIPIEFSLSSYLQETGFTPRP
ncbi:fungal-specific transcription factor domain-containing protein [Lipomyces kononenkoae]